MSLSTHAQSKITKREYEVWLRCKRELARLHRGMEEISDLRRKYGKHAHFDLAEKSQQAVVAAADKELSEYESELEAKYRKKEGAA